MAVRFTLNRGADDRIKRSVEMQTGLRVLAGRAAQAAEGLGKSVAASYRVEVADGDDGAVELRASSGGINAAGFIEMGTSNNPAYAPLRRGVESAGLKLTGGGR